MKQVTPKKSLGQHFLNDPSIAADIVASLKAESIAQVVEVGPGMGALTGLLLQEQRYDVRFVEVDTEAADYLEKRFPNIAGKLVRADFLRMPLDEYPSPLAIIGNFPYNISSQIFFRILEYRSKVAEVVCMLQKEVAERIAAPPGSKTYGITSVLLQAFYDIEYLFTVHEDSFTPSPKVKSGVVRLTRNGVDSLPCDEKLFIRIVKTAFNQRRKMLSNSLKPLLPHEKTPTAWWMSKRPEQLAVSDFVNLTNSIGTKMVN